MDRSRAGVAACAGLVLAVLGLAVVPSGRAAAAPADHEVRRPLPTAVAAPGPAAAIAPVTALQADSLVESYGVGVHLGFLGSPYTSTLQVAAALDELGVRHVRDDLILSDNSPLQYAAIGLVAQQAGVKFDLIMGRPDRPGTPADYVRAVATLVPPGSVESLEGLNEWDLVGPQGPTDPWVKEMKDWQAQLYAAARAEPATAGLPVLGPALAFRQSYAVAGDLQADSDLANAHMYPGGYRPANQIPQITAALRASVPTKPLVVTESGYHNATSATGGHRGVPEAVAGVYSPRLLLEHVKRGARRVYSYELLDERDDPTRTDAEAEFGLLHRDFTPKPAYTALKNLLALVDDPGPAFTPTPLAVTADGMPSDARYLLYQKRSGQYVLLLWRDVDVFDPVTQQGIAVPPADVTVRLGVPHSLSVHRPSDGAAAAASTVASSVAVSLDGQVTAVTIDAAPPPAPTRARATPGNRTATVAWTLPATSAPVTGFEVRRSPGDGSRTLPPGARSFRETGLTNRTRYAYQVRTLTAAGASAWTTAPTVVPAQRPRAPRISSVRSGRVPGTVTISWRPADGRGQRITGYRVVVLGHRTTLGRRVHHVTLRGLPTGRAVRIQVQARSAVGWGRKAHVDHRYGAGG